MQHKQNSLGEEAFQGCNNSGHYLLHNFLLNTGSFGGFYKDALQKRWQKKDHLKGWQWTEKQVRLLFDISLDLKFYILHSDQGLSKTTQVKSSSMSCLQLKNKEVHYLKCMLTQL